MPKAFLFDIGNVIVTFDFAPVIANYAERSDIGIVDPMAAIATIKHELESGNMSDEEFVDQSIEILRYHGTRDEFIRTWQQIFRENAPMCESIRAIAAKDIPLYLLSNTNGLHMEHLLADFDIFQCFEGGIYSHEAQCQKPEKEIYHMAIDRFGLDPAETLYIDDLPANFEAGQSLGLLAHLYDFRDHDAFVRFAGTHGVDLT